MTLRFRALVAVAATALALLSAYWLHERVQIKKLNFAAGPSDGEAFQIAEAIANVVQRYNPHLEIAVIETRGSAQNVELLEQGRVQLAAVLADTRLSPSARLIAPLYPDAFQLIAREDSGIETVADLAGHKIALPPPGAGQYDSFWFLAEHYGLKASDFEALAMTPEAANFALAAGAADASFRVRAPGNRSIQSLIESGPMRLIAIDQAAAMRLKQPAIELGTIPKGSYRGHPPLPESDLPTAAVQRLLIASANLNNGLVKTITDVLFERRRDLVSLTPLAGFITAPDRATGTFLPIHPGAQSYYDREKPSFLQENAEIIAVTITLMALFGSGLLRLGSQRRKGRLDTYNRELLVLYDEVAAADERDRLLRQQSRLMEVLGRVVDDAEEGRITAEGFNIFSFTWEAVHEVVRDKLMGARGRSTSVDASPSKPIDAQHSAESEESGE